jgi:DNA-binding CsgD family transcriptional regulator
MGQEALPAQVKPQELPPMIPLKIERSVEMREIQFKSISRGEFLKVAGLFSISCVIAACRLEAITTQTPSNTSGEQRLQTEFNLTPLNARTFWLFVDNRNNHLGRREIARQLHVSRNTLKDHITRIIRHVRSQGYPDVSKLNDAVNVGANIIGFD